MHLGDSHEPLDVVAAFWEDVWNDQRLERVDPLVAEDVVLHASGRELTGRDAFRTWVASFTEAIEDLFIDVQELLASDDLVTTRWRVLGRHCGPLLGVEPTERWIEFTGLALMQVADGVIRQAWVEGDALGLARQLGAELDERITA